MRSAKTLDIISDLTGDFTVERSEYVRINYHLSARYSSSGESAIEAESIANYLIITSRIKGIVLGKIEMDPLTLRNHALVYVLIALLNSVHPSIDD